MALTIGATTMVRGVVLNYPEPRQAFESLGIDCTLPEDAWPTFSALFEGLQELEADLHEHIHLENNILFPRAIAMEAPG